jgi:hypothetical protein
MRAAVREDHDGRSTNQNACDADLPQHTNTSLEELKGLTYF